MKQNIDLVTIVVPVYNVDKYLEECIVSIINQSYSNFELILVNDGSTDNSDSICKKFINNEKVKYISKENEGVSVARNVGINMAKGKWIVFVDGDDYLDKYMIEDLVKQIKNDNTDIVITPPILEYDEVTKKGIIFDKDILFNNKNINDLELNIICRQFGKNYNTDIGAGGPWGKIYNLDFLRKNNLFFIPGLKRMQDVVFNLNACEKSSNVSYRNKYYYHYRINSFSVCIKYNPNIFNVFIEVINHFNYFIEDNKKDSNFFQALYLKTILMYIEGSKISILHKDNKVSFLKKRCLLKKYYKTKEFKNAFRKIKYSNLNFKMKLFVTICKMHLFSVAYLMIYIFINKKNKEQG